MVALSLNERRNPVRSESSRNEPFDCRVAYLALPESVLTLHSKTDICHAMEIYRTQTTDAPSPRDRRQTQHTQMTPYQRRQRADALANLERAGIIEETLESDKAEPLPLENKAKGRIVIPAHFAYSSLSLVALKTRNRLPSGSPVLTHAVPFHRHASRPCKECRNRGAQGWRRPGRVAEPSVPLSHKVRESRDPDNAS